MKNYWEWVVGIKLLGISEKLSYITLIDLHCIIVSLSDGTFQ